MIETAFVSSPLGTILIAAGGDAMTELRFAADDVALVAPSSSLLTAAARALEAYFAGELQRFDLPLAPEGTPFQRAVWRELVAIPHGETRTYGELARRLGRPTASRAVGAANGQNPISILVPCHRVIGANGALTGYAYGVHRKAWLLRHEGATRRPFGGNSLEGPPRCLPLSPPVLPSSTSSRKKAEPSTRAS